MSYRFSETSFCKTVNFQGAPVIRSAKRQAALAGYDEDTGMHLPNAPKKKKEESM